MPELDLYLDRILAEADLDTVSSIRIRAEVRDHLEALVQKSLSAGRSREEAVREACAAFGEPSWLGRSLRHAWGGWRSWKTRWLRPLPVAFMLLLLLGWTVNTYALEVYSIRGAAVAPRLTQGCRVVVEKWGPIRANDIVVFKEGDRSMVGIVEGCPVQGPLSVRRNDIGSWTVDRSRVVGRVVWKFL
jgi:hypothetical protein